MNIDKSLEKYMPWHGDMGHHPDAAFLPFYTSGRCQNPDSIDCPYCGRQHEPWEVLTEDGGDESRVECSGCDLEFKVEASFGYGYSTYPKKCRSGHNYVFVGQYFYESKRSQPGWVRVFRCTICDAQDYNSLPTKPLPWRDHYNDPATFDPDGVLDTGTTMAEKIRDRQIGPGTPVLDWLEAVDRRQKWGCTDLLMGMAEALAEHYKIYPVSEV